MTVGALGIGPLVAGGLAQWVTQPLTVPYLVFVALGVVALAGLWVGPETGTPAPPAAAKDQPAGPRRTVRLPVPAAAGTLAAFAANGFMADLQVPWHMDAPAGKITDPAWRAKPSWYLVTTEDRMIPPPSQHTMASRINATASEVTASHSVYVSQPEAVATLIAQAAAGSASQ